MSNLLQHLASKNYSVYDYAWISESIVRNMLGDYIGSATFSTVYRKVPVFIIIEFHDFLEWMEHASEVIIPKESKEVQPTGRSFPNVITLYTKAETWYGTDAKFDIIKKTFPNLKNVIIYGEGYFRPDGIKFIKEYDVSFMCTRQKWGDRLAELHNGWLSQNPPDLDDKYSAAIFYRRISPQNYNYIRYFAMLDHGYNLNMFISEMPKLEYLYANMMSYSSKPGYVHLNLTQMHLTYTTLLLDEESKTFICPKLQQFSIYVISIIPKKFNVIIYTDFIPPGKYDNSTTSAHVKINSGTVEVIPFGVYTC